MIAGRIIRLAIFIFLTAFVAGLILFVREARTFSPDGSVRAQAIVVFTGGPNRINSATRLLQAGAGARLLISGVNPDSSLSDIVAVSDAPISLFECCVDIGLDATDTVGNAAETTAWAALHGYDHLIVVTSNYHMPRALLELQADMPHATFIAYGVSAPAPWNTLSEARRWLTEYVKYGAVYGRERLRAL